MAGACCEALQCVSLFVLNPLAPSLSIQESGPIGTLHSVYQCLFYPLPGALGTVRANQVLR